MHITRRTSYLIPSMALAVLGLAAPQATRAQRAVLTVTGTLQSVYDPDALLDSTMSVGTLFTFTYVFDYIPADARDSSSNYNIYYFTNSGTGATVSFGDYTLTPGIGLNVGSVGGSQNTPPSDAIGFQSSDNAMRLDTSTPIGVGVGLQLAALDGQTLPNNVLPPPSSFTLSNFKPYSPYSDGTYFNASVSGGLYHLDAYIKGSVDTLNVRALSTPEPSAWAALGVGGLGIGGLLWRARKRKANDAA